MEETITGEKPEIFEYYVQMYIEHMRYSINNNKLKMCMDR